MKRRKKSLESKLALLREFTASSQYAKRIREIEASIVIKKKEQSK